MASDRPIYISQTYSREKSAWLLMERFPVEAKECVLISVGVVLRITEHVIITRGGSDYSFASKTPLCP